MYTFLNPTPLNYKTTLRLFYSNVNAFTVEQTTLVFTLTFDCLTLARLLDLCQSDERQT